MKKAFVLLGLSVTALSLEQLNGMNGQRRRRFGGLCPCDDSDVLTNPQPQQPQAAASYVPPQMQYPPAASGSAGHSRTQSGAPLLAGAGQQQSVQHSPQERVIMHILLQHAPIAEETEDALAERALTLIEAIQDAVSAEPAILQQLLRPLFGIAMTPNYLLPDTLSATARARFQNLLAPDRNALRPEAAEAVKVLFRVQTQGDVPVLDADGLPIIEFFPEEAFQG